MGNSKFAIDKQCTISHPIEKSKNLVIGDKNGDKKQIYANDTSNLVIIRKRNNTIFLANFMKRIYFNIEIKKRGSLCEVTKFKARSSESLFDSRSAFRLMKKETKKILELEKEKKNDDMVVYTGQKAELRSLFYTIIKDIETHNSSLNLGVTLECDRMVCESHMTIQTLINSWQQNKIFKYNMVLCNHLTFPVMIGIIFNKSCLFEPKYIEVTLLPKCFIFINNNYLIDNVIVILSYELIPLKYSVMTIYNIETTETPKRMVADIHNIRRRCNKNLVAIPKNSITSEGRKMLPSIVSMSKMTFSRINYCYFGTNYIGVDKFDTINMVRKEKKSFEV